MENEKKTPRMIELTDDQLEQAAGGATQRVGRKQCPEGHLYEEWRTSCPTCGALEYTEVIVTVECGATQYGDFLRPVITR